MLRLFIRPHRLPGSLIPALSSSARGVGRSAAPRFIRLPPPSCSTFSSSSSEATRRDEGGVGGDDDVKTRRDEGGVGGDDDVKRKTESVIGSAGQAGQHCGTGAAAAADLAEAADDERRGRGRIWETKSGEGGAAIASEVNWDANIGEPGSSMTDPAVIELHGRGDEKKAHFKGFGVLSEDKEEDIELLVDGFTAPALAAALRDRETTLHACAHLFSSGDYTVLGQLLKPFGEGHVRKARVIDAELDLRKGFQEPHLFTLKKQLHRMPRQITKLTEYRASVMIPLCNVDDVASILFTKRTGGMRSHKNEVCFPGGKVDEEFDRHIVNTAMRELTEEIGLHGKVEVLGVLRCDWSEVASMVGLAVTPVVGFVGQLQAGDLRPNPTEVSHCFSVPIKKLLKKENWVLDPFKAPVFTAAPAKIWGLTGYVLYRFCFGVLAKHPIVL